MRGPTPVEPEGERRALIRGEDRSSPGLLKTLEVHFELRLSRKIDLPDSVAPRLDCHAERQKYIAQRTLMYLQF